MAGTMGDSTRARIGSAIRTANGGGVGGGDRAPGAYVGGYGGGLGGTWAKAPTQRGGDPMREGTPSVAGSPARCGSSGRHMHCYPTSDGSCLLLSTLRKPLRPSAAPPRGPDVGLLLP